MNVPFVKMHANGNDFVIVDSRSKNYKFNNVDILKLSNRNTGIGFDQLILLEKSVKRDIFMKIYNSDGNEARMCGNAGLCVASLLFASKNTSSISIETISSDINARLSKDGIVSISIQIPPQTFSKILTRKNINTNSINFSKIHSALNSGMLVNMGNAHIVFVVKNLEKQNLLKYGSKIEKNKLFVDGINMEIVEIVNRGKLKVSFWERGAGLTLSCGSGILSAFYACYKNNLCDKRAEVQISLGKVNVEINSSEIIMSTFPSVSYMGEFNHG